MKLIVTSADLKWQGKRLKRGERFEAATDRDQKLAELLKKLGVRCAKSPASSPRLRPSPSRKRRCATRSSTGRRRVPTAPAG
jgi:hypothetical protein